MRTALLSAMFPELSVDELARRLAAWDYDAIELNAEELPWAAPHVTPQTDPATRRHIRRVVAEHGLAISAICAHISLVSADPVERKRAISQVTGCIDLAADVGSDIVHGLTGPVPPAVDPELAWQWAVQAVRACAEYAEDRGVRFAMEAIVNHVVFRVSDMRRLLEEVTDLPLYVNFDPSHYQIGGDDIVEAVQTFGQRIVHVHMKDAEGEPGNFSFPALGKGKVDFAGMVSALRAVGYRGHLSVEYEADRFGDPTPKDEAAQHARKFLGKILEM